MKSKIKDLSVTILISLTFFLFFAGLITAPALVYGDWRCVFAQCRIDVNK